MRPTTPALLGLFLFAFPALAQDPDHIPLAKLPPEVRPFVEAGTRALALERADLDGDGAADFILVLEKQKAKPADPDIEEGQRPLLVLVRQAGGALKLAARNDKVVYCASCGGMMGDPFQGVVAGPRTFTVNNAGGSAWRWSLSYRFNYSRRDAAWQLVRVEDHTYHAVQAGSEKKAVFTPPRHFGKIGLAEFDPQDWKGRGQR